MGKHCAVSVIICSRDRAAALNETLASFDDVEIPHDLTYELLVVDNGSTDSTKETVKRYVADRRSNVSYISESRLGKAVALNTGLRSASGSVIVFTDDDVRFSRNWLVNMATPIVSGVADAVAGEVRIADHLRERWMTPMHNSWIASTECLNKVSPDRMVGANMAFKRGVLDKVPGFDENLGPGALGFGEDSLFALQLKEAGFRIAFSSAGWVEHHCDCSRITSGAFFESAKKLGRSDAYISYHWDHLTVAWFNVRFWKSEFKEWLRHIRCERVEDNGASKEVLLSLYWYHYLKQYQQETTRRRKYPPRQLRVGCAREREKLRNCFAEL
jgi:glycosyltransferase involved in cell wall biosynthesis